MKYQIDQSGKIEDTGKDTILAMSNDFQYTLLLRAKTKRILQQIFRAENRQRMFVYRVFSGLLYLLLKKTPLGCQVIVDKEYPGKEDLIKLQIKEILSRENYSKRFYFEFGLIGKTSAAHVLSYRTYLRKLKANKKVELEEIAKLMFSHKKGSGVPKLTGPRAT